MLDSISGLQQVIGHKVFNKKDPFYRSYHLFPTSNFTLPTPLRQIPACINNSVNRSDHKFIINFN